MWQLRVFKTQGLNHKNLFLYVSIEKHIVDIKLSHRPSEEDGKREDLIVEGFTAGLKISK